MKPYIVFNGVSSDEILDGNLIICSFDYNDTVTSAKRTLQKGSVTKQRDIANDHGVIYDEPLSFNLAFIKEDKSEFTYTEIITVNKWLCTDYNKKLVLYSDLYDMEYYYNGKFEKSEQKRINGVRGIVCSFVNDSAFMYRNVIESKTLDSTTGTSTIFSFDYDGVSDIAYPKLYIKSENLDSGTTCRITVTNQDYIPSNSFTVNLNNELSMESNYIIYSNNTVIPLDDVFYNGQIDWLKIIRGTNTITVDVSLPTSIDIPEGVTIYVEISYKEKILGGILNEFN